MRRVISQHATIYARGKTDEGAVATKYNNHFGLCRVIPNKGLQTEVLDLVDWEGDVGYWKKERHKRSAWWTEGDHMLSGTLV